MLIIQNNPTLMNKFTNLWTYLFHFKLLLSSFRAFIVVFRCDIMYSNVSSIHPQTCQYAQCTELIFSFDDLTADDYCHLPGRTARHVHVQAYNYSQQLYCSYYNTQLIMLEFLFLKISMYWWIIWYCFKVNLTFLWIMYFIMTYFQ